MPSNKKFCLDTSGLSNPLESMPEDITLYKGVWLHITAQIKAGIFAVNKEIYDELCCIEGNVGSCIKANKDQLLLEIGQSDWDWKRYLDIVEELRTRYSSFISEYNQNRKGTVGLNDVSIVALAKALNLPLISMESLSFQTSPTKMRIPRLCSLEGITHLTFNEFLAR